MRADHRLQGAIGFGDQVDGALVLDALRSAGDVAQMRGGLGHRGVRDSETRVEIVHGVRHHVGSRLVRLQHPPATPRPTRSRIVAGPFGSTRCLR